MHATIYYITRGLNSLAVTNPWINNRKCSSRWCRLYAGILYIDINDLWLGNPVRQGEGRELIRLFRSPYATGLANIKSANRSSKERVCVRDSALWMRYDQLNLVTSDVLPHSLRERSVVAQMRWILLQPVDVFCHSDWREAQYTNGAVGQSSPENYGRTLLAKS